MTRKSAGLRRSVAGRLLKIIFGWYFTLAVIVTGIQLTVAYYHVKDSVLDEIQKLPETFDPGISTALWTYNDALLQSILMGMCNIHIITGVNIRDSGGREVRSAGSILGANGHVILFDKDGKRALNGKEGNTFSTLFGHEFSITHTDFDGAVHEIGKGTLYSNRAIVIDRVKHGFVLILINSVIKTLGLWFIFLFFVRRILGKPLGQLAHAVEEVSLENLEHHKIRVHIPGENELSILKDAFNAMLKKLNHQVMAIRKARDELDQKVEERTHELLMRNEQLAKTKEVAETANRAKSAFLANMSHELRTPLNGILGYAQILKRDPATPKKQQHGLDVIEQSGHHLQSLINDVLDLAKVESGKIDLYETDFHLPALIEGVSEIIRIRTERKHLTLCPEQSHNLPVCVHGDERRLRQVLLNLLDNAVKFTDEGSVTLRIVDCRLLMGDLKKPESNDSKIRFEIEDTGVGIPPEALDTIFDPFRQAADREHQVGGSGLGLAISRNLVELMGGVLQVESQVGIGSIFRFDITFPVVPYGTERERPTPKQIVGVQGEPPTVLAVDDNRENRAVFVDLLSPLGFPVMEAVDGRDGLSKAMDSHPDLIIADLRMPEMDGIELIRRIRQSPDLQKTVIIATSASVYEEDRQRSIDAGSDAFLPKPVRAETLFEQLARLLNLTWVERETMDEPDFTDQPMVFPSSETVVELSGLALKGDVNELAKRVSDLARSDPGLKPFSMRMQHFLKRYQLDEINEWLGLIDD